MPVDTGQLVSPVVLVPFGHCLTDQRVTNVSAIGSTSVGEALPVQTGNTGHLEETGDR